MSAAWLYVAVGGALGSVARYAVALALQGPAATFPFATLAVNVLGSTLIGTLAALLPLDAAAPRVFLMAGVLGGFTTMSSFSLEVVVLFGQGRWPVAGLYLAISLLGCTLGCAVGHALGGGLRSMI
jgi:CrcB protein